MITKLPKQPDHDNAVYAHAITGERILVHTFEPVQHWRTRWYEWEDILREAENNPALDDLLKKAEMIYVLTK